MYANYHSHTTRCRHAEGTQREYVENAILSGYRIWGFSDHTPYPFPDGYVSTFRMQMGELESYVEETLKLRDEYRDQIEIHLGLEAEYYPRHFEELIRVCENFPIEYMILGQHVLNNEYDGVSSGSPTDDEAILKAYCDQVGEGLDTGKFLYVAHPDLIHFTGDAAIYEKHMRRLCQKMKACGVPGEINLLGMMNHRNYPNPLFWRIAGEEGIDVVLGTDTHDPKDVDHAREKEIAREMVEKYHLQLKEELDLREHV